MGWGWAETGNICGLLYQTKKAFDFCKGRDALVMLLCISLLRGFYVCFPPLHQRYTYPLNLQCQECWVFTIHALNFLKGHRHEEGTLLNIPAMQGAGDFSVFQKHLTQWGIFSKTLRDVTQKLVPPPAQLTWPYLKQTSARISVTLMVLCWSLCVWPQSQGSLVLRGCVIILQPLGCHRGATGGALENHQNLNYFYFIFLCAVTG